MRYNEFYWTGTNQGGSIHVTAPSTVSLYDQYGSQTTTIQSVEWTTGGNLHLIRHASCAAGIPMLVFSGGTVTGDANIRHSDLRIDLMLP